MSAENNVLVRHAREQDIPTVLEIDAEAFSPYGIAEKPETFQQRLTAFPDGFIILVTNHEIAAFGCSEKWSIEREPGLDEDPSVTHQEDGRVFCITAMAVKKKYQGRGFSLLMLDKLIEVAHNHGCRKIILETSHSQELYQKRGFKTDQNRTEGEVSLDVMSLEIESYGSQAKTEA
ncbi:MAG: GNAT family N-acetyltransferase [Anaerolineales bacterium]|jgi:ribosomal protein S18 acetylase RimI-like enzyme